MSYEQWLERYYERIHESFQVYYSYYRGDFEAYAEHAYGQYQLVEQDHED